MDRLRAIDVIETDAEYHAATTGYAGTPDFDHARFWTTCERWSAEGAHVLVSEYSAPPAWTPLWTVERAATVSVRSTVKAQESLYAYQTAAEAEAAAAALPYHHQPTNREDTTP